MDEAGFINTSRFPTFSAFRIFINAAANGSLNIFGTSLTIFFEADFRAYFSKTLPADMQTVLVYVSFVSSAIAAFSQGNSARARFWTIKFDVLCFLDWFMVQLSECFFIIAGSHG